MSDWSDLAAFEQFNVVTRERDDLRAQLARTESANRTFADRMIAMEQGLRDQLAAAEKSRDHFFGRMEVMESKLAAAQAEILDFINRHHELAKDAVFAQAEVVELRRVLRLWVTWTDDQRQSAPLWDTEAALSATTVAQPLLDAVKLAVEALSYWPAFLAREHRDRAKDAFAALERWVR